MQVEEILNDFGLLAFYDAGPFADRLVLQPDTKYWVLYVDGQELVFDTGEKPSEEYLGRVVPPSMRRCAKKLLEQAMSNGTAPLDKDKWRVVAQWAAPRATDEMIEHRWELFMGRRAEPVVAHG